jgi:membrane protease YdiL (CAAX protease family)
MPGDEMPNQLTASDRRVILLALLVSAASLAIGIKYFSHAFPEASLQLRVNKQQSLAIAEQFLHGRGFHLVGYRHAGIFEYDDEAKLYLERTQGLAKMNQLTSGPVHLWRWSHRWFKPLQKEQFRVEVTPAGQVVGFEHEIPEDRPGAQLDLPAARAIAENFLTSSMGRNPGDLAFVEATTEKRTAGKNSAQTVRIDHTFVWKQKSVDLGEGSYRISVQVDGGQVAGYHEYVKIPDNWRRGYQELRSRNTDAQLVDQVFWVLLSLAMVVILIRRLRDRDVPLRMSFGFGAVAATLYFLGQLNQFSIDKFGYSTTDSYSSFIGGYYLNALLSALGMGALIFLVVAGSEPVYRSAFPGLPSIRRTLSWSGLRSRSFFIANIVGIAMTFFFFAYQTVFYLAANRLGAWAPSDLPFSNQLNTAIPWVSVLFVGFFPAVSEEMQFRAFAIPFLRKTFRSLPAGLIAAAFIWGFLHSAYPNQPFFIRGLEVGFGGIIVGLLMLRFGVVATMIWHYSVDALYTAFLLLRSHNQYLMVSGGLTAGIMLVPLGIALVAYLRSGTFSDEAAVTNAAAGVSPPRQETASEAGTEPAPLEYRPLSNRRRRLAMAAVLVSAGLALIPAYRFGAGIKLRVTRPQAEEAASQFLQGRGVKVASFHRVSWLYENADPLALRYLLQRRSVAASERIYGLATRLELWEVRFFRPLHKEEYRVYVDATDGKVFDFQHLLNQDAPGASLTPAQAEALAGKFVERQGYHLRGFELQNSEAKKQKAREDYTLTWQAKPGDPRNVDQAQYRIEVHIAGNQIVGMARYFKLPEEWVREREASHLGNTVLLALGGLLYLGLAGGFIILFARQVRAGSIPWRRAAIVGVVIFVAAVLSELDRLPVIFRGYDTSTSLTSFWIEVAVSLLVVPLLIGLAGWLVTALAASFYPTAWLVFQPQARRAWRRDAVLAILLSLAAAAALTTLETLFSDRFHAIAPVGIGLFPSLMDSLIPAAGFFLHAVLTTLFSVAAAGLIIYGVQLGWRRRAWWLWAGMMLGVIALGPANAHSIREYLAAWVMGAVPLAVAAGMVVLFFRSNLPAYLGAAFTVAMAQPVATLLSQPAAFFRWNGVVLALLTLAVLAWLLLPGWRSRQTAQQPPT